MVVLQSNMLKFKSKDKSGGPSSAEKSRGGKSCIASA